MNLGRVNKALGVIIVGLLNWWGDITGGPSHVSAKEWKAGVTVVALAFVAYILRNDPAPTPAKPPLEV